MTSSHGRRIQSRRALAIMAWVSLVVIAGLLWYGQENDIIRIQAWEPAALLLSAYSAFLAIFGWLLFAPERRSGEESPALFFSGMLTLIPPCFIAYHLMPPSSPLRGWLTLGIFVFGLMAILSPLPDEVFAVPRDRKSYLQPLTDCYLSALDVDEPQLDLQSLVPRSYRTLTGPAYDREPIRDTGQPINSTGTARDPWTDPFYGTGRSLSQVGSSRKSTYSESRSRGSDRNQNEYRERPQTSTHDLSRGPVHEFSPQTPMPSLTPPPLPAPPMSPTPRAIPPEPTTSGFSRPPMTARSAFAPRESRAPNFQPATTSPPPAPASDADADAKTNPASTGRRPLTEPTGRTIPAVGFQSPSASRPITSSPPPAPLISDTMLGLGSMTAAAPLASSATFDDVLKSAVAEFTTVTEPPRPVQKTADAVRTLLDTETRPSDSRMSNPRASTQTAARPTAEARPPVTDVFELDRQIKAEEAQNLRDIESDDDSTVDSTVPSTTRTSPLSDVKMERIKDEYGGEMVDGTIRVYFEVGQKRAHLHVPFSPPLEGLPEVECEAISDDSVRCKVAVRQPYGIRIEARRSDASRALNTDIGFAAVYTPPSRRS